MYDYDLAESNDFIMYGDFGVDNNGKAVLFEPGKEFFETGVLKVPDVVKEFETDFFKDLWGLIEIHLNKNITKISDGCFKNCKYLKKINLDMIENFGAKAFEGCSSLKTLVLGEKTQSIGASCFVSCCSLESIVINKNNAWFSDFDSNVIATKDGHVLFGCSKSVLNNRFLNELSYCAFAGQSLIGEITIPSNIKIIDSYCFDGCEKLSAVRIESGVNVIKAFAFKNCDSLNSISVSSNVNVENPIFGINEKFEIMDDGDIKKYNKIIDKINSDFYF